ncbi:dermonecrotic toxin domain-containing protein [Pseudomonas sp. NPDC087342]|uniref:dermonecrotic toxin domain-containing protein n=1 Tax=Pseudomonas sp. NPDC087342 TaxID=3364437 RepID=UPI0037FED512
MADIRNIREDAATVTETMTLGFHIDRIKQAIQDSHGMMPPDSLLANEDGVTEFFAPWYLKARKIDRDALKDLYSRRWLLQGYLDKLLDKFETDIRDFAEPLLNKALKDQWDIELDVRVAELRLYVPSKIIFGIDRGADHFKQMTLLDAALHNFEADEAEPAAFRDGSGVFTLDAENAPLRHAMTVAQFVTLCRTLDLGAQYQTHLKGILTPTSAAARMELQLRSVTSDKAAFKLAALLARLKGEVSAHGFGALLKVHDGEPDNSWYGAPMHCHRLSLMGFRLGGIVLFSAVAEPSQLKKAIDALTSEQLKFWSEWSDRIPVLPGKEYELFKLIKAFFANGPQGMSEELARKDDLHRQNRLAGRLIAYIPGDPQHPIKEYDSFTDFMQTLVSQLRGVEYQQFFSRFVDQKDKGVFFARVNERLKTFKWAQRKPLDMGPWWRETPIENANPEPLTHVISGNVWSALFTTRRDKAIADARRIAVPTGDEDAQTRWKRLTGYLDIAWNVFNFAGMLIPGVGEALLALMVAQLVEELAEGFEDWSKGDREEAAGHISSVLINGAQLALMGAGHVLPTGAALSIQPSPFVDNLKSVELPDGKTSLWNPDLTPYERQIPLPNNVRSNETGLLLHDGETVLALDDRHYAIKEGPNSNGHRIRHPSRANAYEPQVAHNGAGAWTSELDRPQLWDEAKVWRRFGAAFEELPSARQGQVRIVSGVDHTRLRRMHVEQESPPALLIDTLRRFKAYGEAEALGPQILQNKFESLYKAGEVTADARQLLLQREYPTMPGAVAREMLKRISPEDLAFIDQKDRLPLQVKALAKRAMAEVRTVRAYEGLYLEVLANADTERLALHSMAALPGWSSSVRIEVRELSIMGKLRDSVGPPDAANRKVLVLNEEGAFEARDHRDQHLHGADDIYSAVLHALPDAEREALGFEIVEGARLKETVQRQPLAQEELSSILEDYPTFKPAYDPEHMKLPGGMWGYRFNPSPATIRYRASCLYPQFTDVDLDEMMSRFSARGELVQQISALEDEFDAFSRVMNRWVNQFGEAPRFSRSGLSEFESRNQIYKTLRQCWQRTGPRGAEVTGEAHSQALDLSVMDLGKHLESMPVLSANFDHVTNVNLAGNGLRDSHATFVHHFRQARQLDLRNNRMTRLPSVIGGMRHLTNLLLSNNQIVLTVEAVNSLRGLTQMRSMSLMGNPLGLLPDISRMRHLVMLQMSNTGVNTWPTGLFLQVRPRHFFLDLRECPISLIPDVAPGSFRAELLARTHISLEPRWMSAQTLEQLKLYVESVGLDPERPFAPLGPLDSINWSAGLSEPRWQTLQPIWDNLEDEFSSFPFFEKLHQLTKTADFKAVDSTYRIGLSAKVWRMIEAMAEDDALRDKIFAEAVAPTECVDGLTQWFNAMGIEVMIHEAYQLQNADLVKAGLVRLAKGKTRLQQVDAIARRHISERLAVGETYRRVNAEGQVTGTIDEVEVHLAFMTDLAERLNLPWQARGMQFRKIAGVTPSMIETAYQRVLALEEGDLLRDAIAELPFWKAYAEGSNRRLFSAFRRKLEALTDFKMAMDERADAVDLTPEARERLKERIRVLAAELGKPESAFAPGQVMTDEAFDSEYKSVLDEMEQLLKKLTQDAMDWARLDKDDAPFA